MPIRVQVELNQRSEWCELDGQSWVIGGHHSCELRLSHASVADRHAHLLLRRGRLIVVDCGQAKRGTVVNGHRIAAPVVLGTQGCFGVGELWVKVEHVEERCLEGIRLNDFGMVGIELPPGIGGVRRFQLSASKELVVAREPIDVDAWAARVGNCRTQHMTQALLWTNIHGKPAVVESVPSGIRLSQVLRVEQTGLLHIPLAARGLIAAHIARALDQRSIEVSAPHGGVSSDMVHLSLDGQALLLVPGPYPPSSCPSDRSAWVDVALRDLQLQGHSDVVSALHRWAEGKGGESLAGEVLVATGGVGIDCAPSSISRLVRIVTNLRGDDLIARKEIRSVRR